MTNSWPHPPAGDVDQAAAMVVSDEVDFWGHVAWEAVVPDTGLVPRNPAGVFALPEPQRLLANSRRRRDHSRTQVFLKEAVNVPAWPDICWV